MTTKIEPTTTTVVSTDTTPYFVEFLDEWTRQVAEIIMEYVISFGICILGTVTNILVMMVYARQGFKESVSISMTTIAFWDLAKCFAGVLERFSGILSVWYPAAAISWSNISVVAFNYLVGFSTYVTSVMAAYVAVERCLCVSVPLKVKWLITPKVTLTASLVISGVVFGSFAVIFGVYDIIWVWDESFNATVAIYRKNKFYLANEQLLFMYYNMSGILWPLVSFVIICVATTIIVYKLRQGSKFRAGQGNAAGSTNHQGSGLQQKQQQQLSQRDRQVVKMLLVIIIIYIVCLSPRISLFITKVLVHDFYFLRRYHNHFVFAIYFFWLSDFTNGTVNFFVFYSMSSSFRATFLNMLTSASKRECNG